MLLLNVMNVYVMSRHWEPAVACGPSDYSRSNRKRVEQECCVPIVVQPCTYVYGQMTFSLFSVSWKTLGLNSSNFTKNNSISLVLERDSASFIWSITVISEINIKGRVKIRALSSFNVRVWYDSSLDLWKPLREKKKNTCTHTHGTCLPRRTQIKEAVRKY